MGAVEKRFIAHEGQSEPVIGGMISPSTSGVEEAGFPMQPRDGFSRDCR